MHQILSAHFCLMQLLYARNAAFVCHGSAGGPTRADKYLPLRCMTLLHDVLQHL